MKRICFVCFFTILVGGMLSARATEYYVSAGGSDTHPYTNWSTAAHSIHDAVAAAGSVGNTVYVTNGVYALTNEIVISDLSIRSWNNGELDRDGTIINGNYPATTNRCFYLKNVAALVEGFTITNGYRLDTNIGSSLNSYGGGGVYMTAGTVRNCLVTGNQLAMTSGERGGGGIHALGDSCLVENCDIIGNDSNQRGGGAFIDKGAQMRNCRIIANEAVSYGGGCVSQSSGTLVENCVVASNILTSTSGGGVALRFKGSVRNCLLWGNSATSPLFIQPEGNSHTVENCTVVGNLLSGYNNQSQVVTNSYYNVIVTGNRSTSDKTVNLYYHCHLSSTNNVLGSNNITHDPAFVDFENNNFRLSGKSPCINAGTNLLWMVATSVDLDGNKRVFETVDIGCYEFRPLGTTILVR